MAAVYTLNGNEITVGLQGCNVCDEAMSAAKRAADRREEPVVLTDDDGHWLVYPATWTGGEHGNNVIKHRHDADFIAELDDADDVYDARLTDLTTAYYDNDQGLRTRV